MKVRTLAFLTSIIFLLCFFSAVKAQEVRFYTSSTCGPCQLAKPKMAALAAEGVAIRQIDVAQYCPEHITRVPAYEFVDARGQVVFSSTGAAPIKRLRELWNGRRQSAPEPRQQPNIDASDPASRVCRIQVHYVGGKYSEGNMYGTGCYVTNGEETYIQSCNHNFRPDPGETITGITAHFVGFKTPCTIVNRTKNPDLAKLQPQVKPPFEPLVATGQMKEGETVRWYGFGKGWKMRTGVGVSDLSQLSNGYGNVNLTSGPLTTQGDSGGPIINSRNEVVGVLFSRSDEGKVYLTCCREFQTFFGIRRTTPRRTIQPAAQPAPTPAPPQPANLPPRDCGCRDEFSRLNETLAIAIKRIELLEALPSECPVAEPGPRGERGPQGLQGPQGEQGPAGADADTTELELKISQLEADLKKEQARKVRLEIYRSGELVGVSEGRSTVRFNVDELE